jgi:carbonic anhydrase/acetyltransferase-like protein (isoleucine patch superfamily)
MIRDFKGKSPIIADGVFIAETAVIIGEVIIKKEASIWYNVVIRGDDNRITIGERTNIQDQTMIHIAEDHSVTIGNDVTVGHKAMIHGCVIEDRCLIGMGAIILDGAHIEENVIIGAGSLVTQGKRIPKNSLVLGSPAKVIRALTDEELTSLTHASDIYVKLSKEY